MQKRKLFNILRIVTYCFGFPLLFIIGLIASMPFFNEPVYAASCANGILVLLGIWAIVEIIRLSMKFALRKHRLLQTVITIIVAIIVMAVPMFAADTILSKDFAKNVENNKTISVRTFKANEKIALPIKDDSELENSKYSSLSPEEKINILPPTNYLFTLPADYTISAEKENIGFEAENYEKQVGWFKVVTNKKRKDDALYWKLLNDTDNYMRATGINKWLNFNDYKFNNYSEENGGLALGVNSMLDKEIEELSQIIAFYNYNKDNPTALTLSNTEEIRLQNLYDAAIGKANKVKACNSGWSISALLKLKNDLATKPQLYPFLAVRNYIYIFLGIIPFVYILIYFYNEKRLATPENEMINWSYLKKFKKDKSKDKDKKEEKNNVKEEKVNE